MTSRVDEIICAPSLSMEFVAAPAESEQEAYICFGFDASALRDRPIGGLRWTAPARGAVTLHHATLVATAQDYPDGPVECGEMPRDAIGIHVLAPGGAPLLLPAGIGLDLPESTRRLIIEAHVFRSAPGSAGAARADLCTLTEAPRHLARWLGVTAPVPAIRPRSVESTTAHCTMTQPFTLVSTWPHMHRLGKEFHGAVLRRDGSRESLIDLDAWDFTNQRTYPLATRLEAGDALETSCVWENPTNEYVLPGQFTANEMCNQGVIGWPGDAAHCEYPP